MPNVRDCNRLVLGGGGLLLFLYGLISSLLFFVCGNGLLKGRNWARVLGVGFCFAAMLIALVGYEWTPDFWINLIADLIFTVIVWFFLFLPASNAFFKENEGSLQGE